MEYILQIFASIFEWIALLSFPIVLLGYSYRKYLKPIIIISTVMSLFSLSLHMTSLQVVTIVLFQIVFIYILTKYKYKSNYIETLVLTSIGYVFYIFIQLIFFEASVLLFNHNYAQFFFTLDIKLSLQVTTMSFILAICYFIHYYKLHLNELRYYITLPRINSKYKKIIIINSLLTFILIYLVIFTMLSNELYYKYNLIVGILVTLLLTILVYIFLHYQFQKKRLIETKKNFLDNQHQIIDIVEKVKEDYEGQLQAILQLSKRNSVQLINSYFASNQIQVTKYNKQSIIDIRKDLTNLDELLYAFIVNKRKLACILGIKIKVKNSYKSEIPTTLNQIQCLSHIMNVLILVLYKMPNSNDKTINFEIEVTDGKISFTISTNIELQKEESDTLNLFDSLIMFKEMDATIESNLKPVNIKINCPIT